jgi:hypothetical protein
VNFFHQKGQKAKKKMVVRCRRGGERLAYEGAVSCEQWREERDDDGSVVQRFAPASDDGILVILTTSGEGGATVRAPHAPKSTQRHLELARVCSSVDLELRPPLLLRPSPNRRDAAGAPPTTTPHRHQIDEMLLVLCPPPNRRDAAGALPASSPPPAPKSTRRHWCSARPQIDATVGAPPGDIILSSGRALSSFSHAVGCLRGERGCNFAFPL